MFNVKDSVTKQAAASVPKNGAEAKQLAEKVGSFVQDNLSTPRTTSGTASSAVDEAFDSELSNSPPSGRYTTTDINAKTRKISVGGLSSGSSDDYDDIDFNDNAQSSRKKQPTSSRKSNIQSSTIDETLDDTPRGGARYDHDVSAKTRDIEFNSRKQTQPELDDNKRLAQGAAATAYAPTLRRGPGMAAGPSLRTSPPHDDDSPQRRNSSSGIRETISNLFHRRKSTSRERDLTYPDAAVNMQGPSGGVSASGGHGVNAKSPSGQVQAPEKHTSNPSTGSKSSSAGIKGAATGAAAGVAAGLSSKAKGPQSKSGELNANLPEGNIKSSKLDADLSEGNMKAPKANASLPASQIKAPKLDANLSGANVKAPQLDANLSGANVKAPQLDANLSGTNVKSPQLDTNIESPKAASGGWKSKLGLGVKSADVDSPEMKSPSIDTKTSETKNTSLKTAGITAGLAGATGAAAAGLSGKFNAKSPEINASGANANIDSPSIDANIPQGNIKSPKFDASAKDINLDTSAPTVDSSLPNVKSSKIDASLPEGNIKGPSFDASLPESHIKTSELESSLPKVDTSMSDAKKPNVDATLPEAEFDSPEVSSGGWKSMLGFGGSKPKVESRDINLDSPKVDMNALSIDAKGPSASVEGSQLDTKSVAAGVAAGVAGAAAGLSGKLNKQSSDIKSPELSAKGGNLSANAPGMNAEGPSTDADLSQVDAKSNSWTSKIPGFGAKTESTNIESPNIDAPHIESKGLDTHGLKFDAAGPQLNAQAAQWNADLPALNTESREMNIKAPKANIDSPDLNINAPHSDAKSPSINAKGAAAGVAAGVAGAAAGLSGKLPGLNTKAPEIKGTDFEANANAPQVNTNTPKLDANLPKLDANLPKGDINSSRLDAKLPSANINAPNVNSSLPSAKLDSPSLDTNIKASKLDASIKAPKIDAKSPNTDLKSPKVDTNMSGANANLRGIEAQGPTVSGNLPSGQLSGTGVNANLSGANTDGHELSTGEAQGHGFLYRLGKFGIGPKAKLADVDTHGGRPHHSHANAVGLGAATGAVAAGAGAIGLGNASSSPVDVKSPSFSANSHSANASLPSSSGSTPSGHVDANANIKSPKLDASLSDSNVKSGGWKSKLGFNSKKAEIKSPNLDAKSPSVDATLPSAKSSNVNAQLHDIKSPKYNAKAPKFDAQAPSAKQDMPSIDAKSPSLDSSGAKLDAQMPSLNAQMPSIDTNLGSKGASFNAQAPSLDTKGASLNAQAPHVEAKSPSFNAKGAALGAGAGIAGTAAALSSTLKSKEHNTDVESPSIKSPNTSTQAPSTDIKSPSVDVSGASVQTPSVDMKSPSVKSPAANVDARASSSQSPPNVSPSGSANSSNILHGPVHRRPSRVRGPSVDGNMSVADMASGGIVAGGPGFNADYPNPPFSTWNYKDNNYKTTVSAIESEVGQKEGAVKKWKRRLSGPEYTNYKTVPQDEIQRRNDQFYGTANPMGGLVTTMKRRMSSRGSKGELSATSPISATEQKAYDSTVQAEQADFSKSGGQKRFDAYDINAPHLTGPSASATAPDVKLDDTKANVDLKKGDLNMSGMSASTPGTNVNAPGINANAPHIELKPPNVSANAPKANFEAPNVNFDGAKSGSKGAAIGIAAGAAAGLAAAGAKLKGKGASSNKDASLDAQSPSFDAHGASIDMPSTNFNAPSLNANAPGFDGQQPSISGKGPSIGLDQPSLSTQNPSVDTAKPSFDSKGASFDLNKPSINASDISAQAPSVQAKGPSFDTQSESMNAKLPSVDTNASSLNPKAPSFQPSSLESQHSQFGAQAPSLDAPSIDENLTDFDSKNATRGISAQGASFDGSGIGKSIETELPSDTFNSNRESDMTDAWNSKSSNSALDDYDVVNANEPNPAATEQRGSWRDMIPGLGSKSSDTKDSEIKEHDFNTKSTSFGQPQGYETAEKSATDSLNQGGSWMSKISGYGAAAGLGAAGAIGLSQAGKKSVDDTTGSEFETASLGSYGDSANEENITSDSLYKDMKNDAQQAAHRNEAQFDDTSRFGPSKDTFKSKDWADMSDTEDDETKFDGNDSKGAIASRQGAVLGQQPQSEIASDYHGQERGVQRHNFQFDHEDSGIDRSKNESLKKGIDYSAPTQRKAEGQFGTTPSARGLSHEANFISEPPSQNMSSQAQTDASYSMPGAYLFSDETDIPSIDTAEAPSAKDLSTDAKRNQLAGQGVLSKRALGHVYEPNANDNEYDQSDRAAQFDGSATRNTAFDTLTESRGNQSINTSSLAPALAAGAGFGAISHTDDTHGNQQSFLTEPHEGFVPKTPDLKAAKTDLHHAPTPREPTPLLKPLDAPEEAKSSSKGSKIAAGGGIGAAIGAIAAAASSKFGKNETSGVSPMGQFGTSSNQNMTTSDSWTQTGPGINSNTSDDSLTRRLNKAGIANPEEPLSQDAMRQKGGEQKQRLKQEKKELKNEAKKEAKQLKKESKNRRGSVLDEVDNQRAQYFAAHQSTPYRTSTQETLVLEPRGRTLNTTQGPGSQTTNWSKPTSIGLGAAAGIGAGLATGGTQTHELRNQPPLRDDSAQEGTGEGKRYNDDGFQQKLHPERRTGATIPTPPLETAEWKTAPFGDQTITQPHRRGVKLYPQLEEGAAETNFDGQAY